MINDLILKVPLVNQNRDTEDREWSSRTCAICSLKMLMAWKNEKLGKLSVMELVKGGLKLDGYIEKIGWKHKALADLAKEHGIKISFIKNFFKNKSEKIKGLTLINKELVNGKPVLASIYYKFKKDNGGHVVVINGFRKDKNKIMGYFIQDPEPEFNGSNYFVSKEEFLDYWRGGLIYFS